MTAPTSGGERFADLSRTERQTIVAAGTDRFLRAVDDIADTEFTGPTLLSGWTRSHLIGHVGHNATALTRLLDWAETGVRTPMYASPDDRNREIDDSARWEPARLRDLVSHSATRLAARWDALDVAAWHAQVTTAQGRTVHAEETLWMRTREVWIHLVDLDIGVDFTALPRVVLASVLADITAKWRAAGTADGLALHVDGGEPIAFPTGDGAVSHVEGPLPGVVQWASGRGSALLRRGHDVRAPHWL
ncbi:maleylpyruvate isomerase family mycothiol-dependent enzyme [Gordonia shandongensis]|uniref:maleylpyruvate isomerase family mycothiol-dependent enzyme n=1 Tax=Gordonia shandongensis TaxID=376351 RepID=UPI000405D132|nr:maleylpyruvate isomerase family mycothiol-dependent enzyme [Gordonia shandongensis]